MQFLLPFVKFKSNESSVDANGDLLDIFMEDNQENRYSNEDGHFIEDKDFNDYQDVQDYLADNNQTQDDSDTTSTVDMNASTARSPESCETYPAAKRRKTSDKALESLDDLRTPSQAQTEYVRENPRKMFLLGILDEVEELTEEQMRLFKRKVLGLLDHIRIVKQDDIRIVKQEVQE